MQKLEIRNIECHAFHGCLPAEAVIGGRFSVSVVFEGDFSTSMQSDALESTVDYVEVHRLVREQMAIPARLIEHVAHRLLNTLLSAFPMVKSITVEITKYNPPVNGCMEAAVFTVQGTI